MECCECGHKFIKYEGYLKKPGGKVYCEVCFWEIALNKLGLEERKYMCEKDDNEYK